jgi:hypothetical protein
MDATITPADVQKPTITPETGAPQTPATDPAATPAPGNGNAGTTSTGATNDPVSPLLVTSASSRATYADNVSKMNASVANIAGSNTQAYNFVDSSGKVQTVQASSPEEALNKAPNIDPTSGVSLAKENTGTPAVGANGAAATGGATSKTAATQTDGSVDNGDGTITTVDGARIDSSLKKLYDNNITLLDDGIATAKANLARTAATMGNNPAAAAAIAQIMAKFDQQIGLMKEQNRQLMGGNITNAARGGALQYANEMTGNFLSDEQGRAMQRVTDLQTQEADLILKTQESYKKGDVAAFDAASKALDAANSDKLKAISDLMKQTDTIVKEKQNQQKIAQNTAKQQITDDIRLSTNLATTVAEAIAASGITDEKKKRAYIEAMAEKNGITNADILQSAVIKADQANTKAELGLANTRSIIAKRGQTGTKKTSGGAKAKTDGSYSYTTSDVGTYSNFLNKGGTAPDGTAYNGRGKDDGFVDPGAYSAAFNDWVSNGGTPKGFAKEFPVKNYVNPASYTAIPAVLKPATKAASGSSPA